MIVNLAMPKLGFSMIEGSVMEWKAKEGGWVEKGSVAAVIQGEKASWDMEAEISGFLHILIGEGKTVPVGQILGMLCETKEELEKVQKEKPAEVAAGVAASGSRATIAAPERPVPEGGARILISPAARKLAEEHHIDITKVTGSGPGGRIVIADIEKAVAEKKAVPAQAAPETYEGRRVARTVPLSGMRKAQASVLYQSLMSTAQMTVMADLEMTEMMKLRETLVKQEEHIGVRVSYTDLFVFCLSRVLREFPLLNASLIGEEVKVWEDINIGVAVNLEEEEVLVVPVIKNADKKSIAEIARLSKELGKKAREGKLKQEDVIGGTFTLSSAGMFAVSHYQTPILIPPQSAMLAVAAIKDMAVVREGQIVIRPMTTVSLTYDHRVVIGYTGERFLNGLHEMMKNPSPVVL